MARFSDDADGDALAHLEELGADLSRPLPLEFAVDVPDGPAAEAVRDALARHGYQARIEYDEGEPDEDGEADPDDEEFGPAWSVYVDITMVPTYEEVMRIQAELDRIAAPLGGRSDGWGALIDGDGGSL